MLLLLLVCLQERVEVIEKGWSRQFDFLQLDFVFVFVSLFDFVFVFVSLFDFVSVFVDQVEVIGKGWSRPPKSGPGPVQASATYPPI